VNWAVNQDLLTSNPAAGVLKLKIGTRENS
jgi:hypothetical protein